MKKISLLLALVICLLCGCNIQEPPPDPDKYSEYKCYDYHLACLNVYKHKAGTIIEEDGESPFRIWFRKPVGISDDQFICTSVSLLHPLASASFYIMQPSENHIDVLKDWTVNKIEIFYQDINKSKKLSQDEPARIPTKVIDTSLDSVVFKEFVDFVTTDTDYSENFDPQEELFREKYNENTTYKLYIRVHFNESKNIVWDSAVESYIPPQSGQRYIRIDKGRSMIKLASEDINYARIDAFPNLSSWISAVIDELIAQ